MFWCILRDTKSNTATTDANQSQRDTERPRETQHCCRATWNHCQDTQKPERDTKWRLKNTERPQETQRNYYVILNNYKETQNVHNKIHNDYEVTRKTTEETQVVHERTKKMSTKRWRETQILCKWFIIVRFLKWKCRNSSLECEYLLISWSKTRFGLKLLFSSYTE